MGQEQRYTKATELLARRRATAESAAEHWREELYRELPQLRRFDGETASLCRKLAVSVMESDTRSAGETPAGSRHFPA